MQLIKEKNELLKKEKEKRKQENESKLKKSEAAKAKDEKKDDSGTFYPNPWYVLPLTAVRVSLSSGTCYP